MKRFILILLVALSLLLTACSTTPGAEQGPDLPDVPPPDFTTLPPEPPPTATASEIGTTSAQSVTETNTIEESFLPGVKRDGTVSEEGGDQPFADKLKKRKKRVDLGLEQQGSESDPVDNILDLEF